MTVFYGILPDKSSVIPSVKAETGLWKDFYRKCVDITCSEACSWYRVCQENHSQVSESAILFSRLDHSFAETNFVDKMADCQKRLVSNKFSSIIAKIDISGAAISMTISIFWQEVRQLKCPGILFYCASGLSQCFEAPGISMDYAKGCIEK